MGGREDGLYVGLMSGTSLDAVDAVLVSFEQERPRLLAHGSRPIEHSLRRSLLAVCTPGTDHLDRVARLDNLMARRYADSVHRLLETSGTPLGQVRAVGSHGQTIRHVPFGPTPYTVQIGNPSLIAELTGLTVVADFRRRDVAAGGQGAPLAPGFHQAFFARKGQTRVVVNIGGIANISILPGDGRPVTGFDTGPGNTLLDAWAEHHLGSRFDQDGAWAAAGQCSSALLESLLEDAYFRRTPPKSTGRERFNLEWLQGHLAQLGDELAPQDVQATLSRLTVETIAREIASAAPDTQAVIVCGGGVHNPTLMGTLAERMAPLPVDSSGASGIEPDFLEAIGFAWLARQTLLGRPGNLPAVTGARGPRILGGIYPA